MNLSGLEFFYFLPPVLLLHWLLPRKAAWQNGFLWLASQVFFASWNVRLLPVLWVATAVDFAVGRFLASRPLEGRELPESEAQKVRRARKVALGISIAFNVGLLGTFKYAGFFASSLNDLLEAVGLPGDLAVLRLALPLGISYWTLQKLAYILDVYYERIPACRDPLAFATFVSFFPQLIAGPITRGRTVLPQFLASRRLSPDFVASGAAWFLLGIALKSWAADWLARDIVDPVFGAPDAYGRASHWVALVGYAAQLFCDFGGYSFMAVGVGKLFGIDLPHNFQYPFLSQSMMEFWRRWHITLNTWLFDYLFAPMTTGRGWFRGRMVVSFLVVFLISGLWHGATWSFVLWGLLQGIALAVAYQWDVFYKGLCRKDRKWVAVRNGNAYAFAAWALTQTFFVLSLIPFRMPTLDGAWRFLSGLFVQAGEQQISLFALNLLLAFATVIGFHVLEIGRFRKIRAGFFALPAPVRGLAYGLVVVFLLIYAPVGGGTFIYAQF